MGFFREESNPGIDTARAVMHPVVVVVGNGPELRGELGSHGGCRWKGVVRTCSTYISLPWWRFGRYPGCKWKVLLGKI